MIGKGSAAILIGALAGVAMGAPPTLEHFYPAGAQKGAATAITATGTFPNWPTQVWCDSPGVHFTPAKEAGHFSVQVDQSALAGPHLVRLFTSDGASAPRLFIVSDQREISEAEPNDELAKAQVISPLPATINGQLEKGGDVDSFVVKLGAGQTLVASLQGRRLGSAIDPMLHLLDAAGVQQAFSQDDVGLDPLLVFTAKTAGNYVLRVSAFAFPPAADIHLAGGKNAVYRLSVTTGAFPRYASPAAIARGQKGVVRLHGWNLPKPLDLNVDATFAAPWQDELLVPISSAESPLHLQLVDSPASEAGPTTRPAEPLSLPISVTGRIPAPHQEPRFAFKGGRGQRWVISATCAALGSAFDPVIRIEDAKGKTIAQDDDGGGRPNAALEWAVPADGEYTVAVSDRYRQGGDGYVYQLEIRRPRPTIQGVLDVGEYRVMPGQSVPVHVKLARKEGFTQGLIVTAASLPAGVSCTAAEVAASGAEATISIAAAPNAAPANGPFKIILLGLDPQHPFSRPATLSLDGATGQELIPQTQDLWITIPPAPPTTQPKKKP